MIVTGFVANGAKVYISSRSKDVCDKVAKELSDKGKNLIKIQSIIEKLYTLILLKFVLGPGKAVSIPADLNHLNEVKRLANEIEKREGSKFQCRM